MESVPGFTLLAGVFDDIMLLLNNPRLDQEIQLCFREMQWEKRGMNFMWAIEIQASNMFSL